MSFGRMKPVFLTLLVALSAFAQVTQAGLVVLAGKL